MKQNTYANVVEMVRGLIDDPEFSEDLEKQISERNVAKRLFATRTAKGVSQQRIADLLECLPGHVSKIENGLDKDITLGALQAYASALNVEIGFLVRKPLSGSNGQCFQIAISEEGPLESDGSAESSSRSSTEDVNRLERVG